MADESLKLNTKVVTKPFLVLAVLAIVAVVLIFYRYVAGRSSHQPGDGYPWGLGSPTMSDRHRPGLQWLRHGHSGLRWEYHP
jgi:Ni/Fe-hydrogenase subunit HybB-like protein